jgi:hypothetical protein
VANYNANINLTVTGASRLNAVTSSVQKLNDLAQNLKPLNLLAPGAGQLGNKIRTALKPITDFARDIENGNKRISNTFQGASQQADVFKTVLQNVKIQAGGYEKQVASVKLYANALANAEQQVKKLDRAQNDLLRTAQGLQLQNERDAEVISRRTRVSRGREAQAQARQRTENVIIGGAFPMLFGAGPGAVLGGAAGGLIPGNPMLSVATSALGAVLDQFAAQATELGKSLQDPIKNFDALKEANLLASSSQERYIQKLIESGKVAEAQAAIQAELFKKVSTQGVADLQNLGAASTKLSRAWAEFNLQLQTAIAGPMAGLLSWLASVINISNTATREAARQGNISQGLSAKDKAALQKEEARILQGANIFNEAQKRQQVAELYSNYQSRAGTVSTGAGMSAASQETVQLEKAKTSELKAQVDLAAKQLSLAGVDVNINREGYAVRAKRVALQEYENKLLEIKNSFIGKAFDAERNTLMIREANLNYAAKLNNIDAQVRESAARAAKETAEKNKQNYIKELDYILQINDAKTEFNNIQVAIQSYTKGEAEGLRAQAAFGKSELDTKLKSLEIQTRKALLDATDENVRARILDLYKKQVINAKQVADLEYIKKNALADQLDLQEKLTAASEERSKGQQLRSLETQAQKLGISIANPFGGPAAEEALLLLDQQVRKTETLGEVENKILDLKARLQVAVDNQQKTAAEGYTDQIAKEQAYLVQLTERLGILDQLEQKQLQQNQLMQQYGNIIVSELSTAMSGAVTAVINGTGTVQEAFATMFQNIGTAFVDMATRMIAQALVMKVLGILMPSSSSPFSGNPSIGSGGGFGSFTGGAFGSGGVADLPGLGGAGALSAPGLYSGVSFRASGGPVTGGSPYIVGERGPELFVPGTGGSVVPSSDLRSVMGSAPGMGGSPVLNMSFETSTINGVEYVSRDQLEAAMVATRRQAARDGANRGMTMTLDRLQQSPSTRRKVGI